jgi:serine/threonine-protein kinase
MREPAMNETDASPDPDAMSGERESVSNRRLLGQAIGDRYQVVALLGSGGMADVYEVEHRALGVRFALKLLSQDLSKNPTLKARFEREARAVAKLSSPHIVSIVDCGTTQDGAPYFVMERLRGSELRRTLQTDGVLAVQRTLHIGIGVCRALEVAHTAGVIHRDLKPENLYLVQGSDERELCKVLDFGVAKLIGENPTLPGTLMGTARYMAPEQIGAAAEIGPATDVFALGGILFECLVGKPPFAADTLERVLYAIMNEAAPSLSELRPELPPGLCRLVERMLAKAPAERPQSASEVATALSSLTHSEAPTRVGENDATLVQVEVPASLVAPEGAAPQTKRSSSLVVATLAFVLGAGLGIVIGRSASSSAASAPGTELSAAEAAPQPASAVAPEASTARAEAPVAASVSAVTAMPPAAAPALPAIKRAAAAASLAPASPASPPKPPLFFPQEKK